MTKTNKPQPQSILITGVAGFVGNALAIKLLNEGFNVTGIIRKQDNRINNLLAYNHFKPIVIDLNDDLSCLKEMNFEFVFHCASIQPSSSNINLKDYFDGNSLAINSLLENLKLSNISLFINFSSATVLDNTKIPLDNKSINPISLYSISKYAGEQICKIHLSRYSCNFINLRLPSLFGKDIQDGFIHFLYDTLSQNNELELFDKGAPIRAVLYLKDLVNLCVQILSFNNLTINKTYAISNNESLTVIKMATLMKKKLKSNSKIILKPIKSKFPNDMIISNQEFENDFRLTIQNSKSAIYNYLRELEC